MTRERVVTLDAIRGVAVMGILTMNIASFALPAPAYLNPRAYGGDTGWDLASWAVNFLLFDGRMRGLFSCLFGASLLLIAERAEAAGENVFKVHAARMGWLLVFGLAQLVLLWDGDILHHYALIGMIAFAFRKREVHELLVIAGMLIAWDFVLQLMNALYVAGGQAAVTAEHAPRTLVHDYAATVRSLGTLGPHRLSADLAVHRGSYVGLVAQRLREAPGTIGSQLIVVGPETLAYMLLGMAALRSGLATGNWPRARYRRWATWCFAATLPLYVVLGWWQWRSGFAVPVIALAGLALTVPLRPVTIAGWACLAVLTLRIGGRLTARVAAAGRAAFSNYIGTSLVCTTLFYGYGLGLYGRLDRAVLVPVVIAIWLLILGWSRPWLARFRFGPLEWLWRSLARWRVQSMRHSAA